MPTRRPQVLFLVHRVPYPPNRGDRIRSFHVLEFLARCADVWLAFLAERAPEAGVLEALRGRCARVEGVVLGRAARWLRAARSLALGRTATEGLFASPTLRRTLDRWTRQQKPDAVLVFCSSMFQYLDVAGLRGVRAVVDLVDVDSQKWLDYAATSRGWKRRLFALEGRRLRRLEQAVPQRADAVVLVGAHEAALYRTFCPAGAVHVVPNGVDLAQFRPSPAGDAGSGGVAGTSDCVFVGALDYRANLDGLEWFCREVWPQVLRRRPEAVFSVVGSNPSAAARRLGALPGVRLVGEVPDVRPHVASAGLVVAPLRVARGLQNKVLEALAQGKAVVASPQALEGLDVDDGVHACRAAGPAEWADAITGLLDDPARRERLGRAGRAYVESRHRWEDQLAPLASLLGIDADGPPPAGASAHPVKPAATDHV